VKLSFDIAVLGGGPAGIAAASVAAGAGASTVVIDETAAADSERPATDGAMLMPETQVWGLGGGPLVAHGAPAEAFRLDILTAGGVATLSARALIVCTGAQERIIPYPGWMRPGVLGLLTAARHLRAGRLPPGAQFVVGGAGPLLWTVVEGIRARGGSVAAVVDAGPGTAEAAIVAAAGIPVLSGWRIADVLGEGERVVAVDVAPLGGDERRRIACDAVCAGHGLTPATEATRLFRAAHRYDATRGGWVPELDAQGRTSVARLYAAGDCAGIGDTTAALQAGRIAARAAIADLGLVPPDAIAPDAAAPSGGQTAVPAALLAAIPPDCVVCPCETVTRASIETAADAGARDLNQLKQFTRCGMGECQGRICGEAAAELLAPRRGGGRASVGCFTARLPLRPVPMQALLGDFDYADIPIPAPAPP
jgi:thioredoxin reductase/bacterioferritin-associated ferredoxin